MPMNQEVKRKWVKALRSGDYEQGFGRLRSGNKFCVLGVLCNLHAQEHPGVAKRQKDTGAYLKATHCLPHQVIKWAGLGDDHVCVGIGDFHKSLINLNDTRRLSFKELAAAIEFSNL